MADQMGTTSKLLDRHRRGDAQAAREVIEHAYKRFRLHAQRMIASFPVLLGRGVDRGKDEGGKQGGYVCAAVNKAAERLFEAHERNHFKNSQHFMRIACKEIQRALVKLKAELEKHYGQLGSPTDPGGQAITKDWEGEARPESFRERGKPDLGTIPPPKSAAKEIAGTPPDLWALDGPGGCGVWHVSSVGRQADFRGEGHSPSPSQGN